MGRFEAVLTETLAIVTRLGIPVIILFVIGYLLKIAASSQHKNGED